MVSALAQTPGQLNLYAYCNNNPIMFTDETGEIIFSIILSALIGAVISAVASIGSQLLTTGEVDWAQVGISAAFGAVGGALSFTGIGGVAGQFAIQGALGVGETYALAGLNGTASSISFGEVVGTFLFSGVLGTVGAKGAATEFRRIGQIERDFLRYSWKNISKKNASILKTVTKRGRKYMNDFIKPTIFSSLTTGGISAFANVSYFWGQKIWG